MEFTKNRGVNLILDCVASSNYNISSKVLAMDSRWVVYGFLGGHKVDSFSFLQVVGKRC